MLSVLLAVPKTPLYKRLEAEGRLLTTTRRRRPSHYVGTSGGTNFQPLNMTQEELRKGQEALYRRLYAPEAFAERLLGTLSRFNDVKYVPERFTVKRLLAGPAHPRLLLAARPAGAASSSSGCSAGRLASRRGSVKVIMMKLGMYLHFCEVHARKTGWDPWAEPAGPPHRRSDCRFR